MAVHEVEDRGREAAELAQQLEAPLRVPLDDRELFVFERRRLLEDAVRHRELAHVVEQAADRERAEAPRREAELLADLNGAQRDSARVLLRRLVLFCEPLHECMDAGAEERFLLGDELGGAEVTDERARLGRAAQVDRDRHADDHDSSKLERVADPPAEIHPPHERRRRNRGHQPGDPDDDGEVDAAARQQVRLQCPQEQDSEERHADDERGNGARAARRRDVGDDGGEAEPDHTEADHRNERSCLEPEERFDAVRAAQRRKRRQREDRRACRQGERAGQGEDAVVADDRARGCEPVDREQRGHHGEGRAEQDHATVACDECRRPSARARREPPRER